jgi:hypothetical protein
MSINNMKQIKLSNGATNTRKPLKLIKRIMHIVIKNKLKHDNCDSSSNGSINAFCHNVHNNIIICSGTEELTRREPFDNKKQTISLDVKYHPNVNVIHNMKYYVIDEIMFNAFDNILLEFCPRTLFMMTSRLNCDENGYGEDNNYELLGMFWKNIMLLASKNNTIIFNNFSLITDINLNKTMDENAMIFKNKLKELGIIIKNETCHCIKKIDVVELHFSIHK